MIFRRFDMYLLSFLNKQSLKTSFFTQKGSHAKVLHQNSYYILLQLEFNKKEWISPTR